MVLDKCRARDVASGKAGGRKDRPLENDMGICWDMLGVFHKWGYPNSWMVYM